jgi:hypothetical protein
MQELRQDVAPPTALRFGSREAAEQAGYRRGEELPIRIGFARRCFTCRIVEVMSSWFSDRLGVTGVVKKAGRRFGQTSFYVNCQPSRTRHTSAVSQLLHNS